MSLRRSLRREYKQAYDAAAAGSPMMNAGAPSGVSYTDLLMMVRKAGHLDGQRAFAELVRNVSALQGDPDV